MNWNAALIFLLGAQFGNELTNGETGWVIVHFCLGAMIIFFESNK